MTYARIAINAPVHTLFDYHIPPELEDNLKAGHLVQVPFRTAQEYGIVVMIHDEAPAMRTKAVKARLDPEPILTPAQIDLGLWLSETYLAPAGMCLFMFLPPGVAAGRDIRVTLLDEAFTPTEPLEAEIIALLRERGAIRGRQFNQLLTGKRWRAAVDALAKLGAVVREDILIPAASPKRNQQTVALAVDPREFDAALQPFMKASVPADLLAAVLAEKTPVLPATRRGYEKLAAQGLVKIRDEVAALAVTRTEAQARIEQWRGVDKSLRVLRYLAREREPVAVKDLTEGAGVTLAHVKKMESQGLVRFDERAVWRDSLADRDFVPMDSLLLTPEQKSVWEVVRQAIQARQAQPAQSEDVEGACFLLHGVTGSGKTEIYLRAIQQTLAQGRQAIFLVPEIALTPQTLRRVASRFPGRVAVIHSGLSVGERYDTWRRARDGMIDVIVGARSGLFAPLPNIGLIVLDEEHDNSYKQSESGVGFPPPYYHARTLAEEMARRNNAVLILGSATPDLESSYRARRGDMQLLRLPSRIMGHRVRIHEQAQREGVETRYVSAPQADDALMIDLPPVQTVDMRSELKAGNTSIFSRALQAALHEVLQRDEQAILFINRRGQASYVFCRDCGYIATCPRCDTPLTHHRMGEALRCHRCGYDAPIPRQCPTCGSARIKYFGAGTQQVEQALHVMFPKARTVRWDADTAHSPDAHEAILERFIQRKADIMVGTQMVAKGLDLPLVTLVGVVSADLGLALPDFRTNERTFQVLTQVAGRAGRGLLGGRVILQTYQPEHYAVIAASGHDYEAFYEREITNRRNLGYPPFRRLVRLVFRHEREERARREAERAADILRGQIARLRMTGTELIGPAPCFFTKVNQYYRWHLLLRGPNPVEALRDIELGREWFIDVDPAEVL